MIQVLDDIDIDILYGYILCDHLKYQIIFHCVIYEDTVLRVVDGPGRYESLDRQTPNQCPSDLIQPLWPIYIKKYLHR